MLPRLPEQSPPEAPVGSVTAEGACGTRACHAAIAAREAGAAIPLRRNGRPWQGGHTRSAGAQRDPARKPPLRPDGPEALARASATTPGRGEDAVPELPGERLMARDLDRQTAGLQLRIVLMNRFSALGTPETALGMKPTAVRGNSPSGRLRDKARCPHGM